MKTTREINVDLTKGKLKLRHVTTKDIDAGVRVEPPKEPIKPRSVSTTTLPDVADIAEKKRRDDIMAERKAQSKVEIITAPAIVKDGEGNLMPTITDEGLKKLAMKERMAKVRAAKAKKK